MTKKQHGEYCCICGAEIPPVRSQRMCVTCSTACQQRYRRGSAIANRTCDYCGDTYLPQRNTSKYCSSYCRLAAHRELKKES